MLLNNLDFKLSYLINLKDTPMTLITTFLFFDKLLFDRHMDS